jgi:peptidoglycan/LPS O-acetylase OafA/YrhL
MQASDQIPEQAIAAKPHYAVLDGLRGVAALIVVAFHILEPHSTSHRDQIINHGYLAVDFFFLLSGFVIGYAYDDRWQRMTVGQFFRRRLERLQPMVILGMVIGAIMFYFQANPWMPKIEQTPVWQMLLVMVIGCTLIPLPPSQDIRGWNEIHPLNGPGWSLFYEYIANILYALIGRRLGKKPLVVLVFLSACALVYTAVFGENGDVIGGWELSPSGLRIGFSRMMFPFFAGLLLFRVGKIVPVKNGFLWSSLLLALVLAFPRIGGEHNLWLNGVYESIAIIVLFPAIVLLGAGGLVQGASAKVCKFLGDISYPIYITHYPFIYAYTAYVAINNRPLMSQAWPYMLLTYVVSVGVAYAALKLYDEPVRKWLKKR